MAGPAQLPAQFSAFPIVQTLVRQIQRAAESNLTGSLNFDTVHVPRMRLYFVMGRLVWAGGGLHRLRRWRRLLNQHCPETACKLEALAATRDAPQSEYEVLRRLVQSGHISREVARNIIRANLVEVLFDVIQASKLLEKFSCNKTNFAELRDPITLISLEELINAVEAQWCRWCEANLAPYSPNLAPALTQPESLRGQVAPQTYDRLVQMLQGQLSMRELAVLVQWDLNRFGQSMIAYEQQGIVQLRITPDLILASHTGHKAHEPEKTAGGPASSGQTSGGPVSAAQAPDTKISSGEGNSGPLSQAKPLVMCVDDSPSICSKMKRILEGAGYRFMAVSDPIQALPLMLEKKPELLLIDLVMPVIGGYELTSQIRRIPAFQHTPLIIFSGNMLDRIRAKLAGANDTLSKLVSAEEILAMVERWLPVSTSV